MTATNNPKNQQPHGLGNLVQINKRQGNTKARPWVIVENPGTDFEKVVAEFEDYRHACNWMERNYTDDDCPADVMRRRDDGFLTTEY